MKAGIKNIAQYLVGIIFSVISIYIISDHVNFKQVIDELKLFSPYLTIFLFLFYPCSIYLRSLRWHCLIQQKSQIPINFLIGANVAGFFTNYILPAKLGEVLRAEIVKQKHGVSRSFVLTTIVAERLLDAMVLLIFLTFSTLFSKTIQNLVDQHIFSILLFLLLISFFILFILNKRLIFFVLKFIPVLNKRSNTIITNVLLALSFFKNRILFIKVFLITITLWSVLTIYYLLISIGLDINLPYYGYFFLISMAAFGMILPAAPGNIGVYDGIVMAAILIFFPSETEKALSFAIISHVIDLIPTILFGIISIQYFGFSLKINSN